MFFPYSFFGASFWSVVLRSLQYTEMFGTFFDVIWNPITPTLQYTEHFSNTWFDDGVWTAVTPTIQYTETFNPWP